MAAGHEVTVLSRGPSAKREGWRAVSWNATTTGDWVQCLEAVDVVVHLSGERVDCRATKSNIDGLISSRERTVQLVGRAVAGLKQPPKAWVQLSSLAIFGDGGETVITEDTEPPTEGLRQQVEVCQRWEAAYREVTAGLSRTVLLRPGIAIGGIGDPATEQLARLARLGFGGSIGGGQQWVSWIASEDFFDLLFRAVTSSAMQGLYHLTSPEPVRNQEFMAAYRSAVGKTKGLASPAVLTKAGAWLLGADPALVLTGRRCVPQRLLNEGYDFGTTDIDVAVADAVLARG